MTIKLALQCVSFPEHSSMWQAF